MDSSHSSRHQFRQGRFDVGRTRMALGTVLFAALGLRVYRIDWQSVWHDEVFTLYACLRPLPEMTALLVQDYVHPPLHYYLVAGWMAVFGYGALEARLLSALFGVVAVAFTGLLGRTLLGRRTGVLAALLLAVSTFGVMYSHEARCYSQLLFFTAAAAYFFVTAARERCGTRWLAFVVCAAGTVLTHYYGALTLAVLAAFGLLNRREYRIPAWWWIGGLTLVLALFAPWAFSGAFERMFESRKVVIDAAQHPSLATKWFTFVASLNWFNNGKWFGIQTSSPVWLVGLGGLLFTVPALYGSRSVLRGNRTMMLLNALWLVPLAAILVAGVFGVQYNFRYTVFLAAPYYVVVASGLAGIEHAWLRRAWIAAIIVHSLIGLRAVYYLPFKEDYRAGVAHVAAEGREGDCTIFLPAPKWGEEPRFWYVYRPDRPPPGLTNVGAVASGEAKCERVWLVWDRTWWMNRDPTPSEQVVEALERGHDAVDRKQYYGMEVMLYQPRRVTESR